MFVLAAVLFGGSLLSCGGGGNGGGTDSGFTFPAPDEDTPSAALLKADEVEAILQSAATAQDRPVAVAVTDRRGKILGVATNFGMDRVKYKQQCVDALDCPLRDIPLDSDSDCAVVNRSVQLARTAAFFSANETPLTSRSVRFLSGEHFPPDIHNTGAAALFGIENTNRGCSFDTASTNAGPRPDLDFGTEPERLGSDAASVPRATSLAAEIDPSLVCQSSGQADDKCGCTTGIATLPGGVPIFRGGTMVGGVGVAVHGVAAIADPVAAFDAPDAVLRRDDSDQLDAYDAAEFAARAFVGDAAGDALPGVKPKGLPGLCDAPGVVPPDCCATSSCGLSILPGPLPKSVEPVIFVDGIEIPEVNLDPDVSGVGQGAPLTSFIVDPVDSDGVAHSGWLVIPRDASAGGGPLTAGDVEDIINAGIAKAKRVRAAIRLPLQQRTAMVLAVSDLNGELLGVFRMPDATVFSIDVAVAKARNVTYFSSETIDPVDTRDCPAASVAECDDPFFPTGGNDSTAITNRTISFASQPFFPPGIDGTGKHPKFDPGPFRRIFIDDSADPCSNAGETTNGRQNGIVFFPGSAPLYEGGDLVGGFGVSGDGVEQDDLVTFAGTQAGFEAPAEIRADQIQVRGDVRLPYLKFNRQPEQ